MPRSYWPCDVSAAFFFLSKYSSSARGFGNDLEDLPLAERKWFAAFQQPHLHLILVFRVRHHLALDLPAAAERDRVCTEHDAGMSPTTIAEVTPITNGPQARKLTMHREARRLSA